MRHKIISSATGRLTGPVGLVSKKQRLQNPPSIPKKMNQNFKHRLIRKWRQGVNKNIETSETGTAQVLKLFWRVRSIDIRNREIPLL